MIRYGIQPSEIGQMTMSFIHELMEGPEDDVMTFADTAALHRFMANSNG